MPQPLWWKEPLRVIQTNLQVLDTPKMDPAKIAQETYDMGGNVLVMNVGGIVAWYPSDVPYHYVNPYLPKEYDLLARLIEECHKRGIKLVARYDFSKAYDKAYQLRPQWFARKEDGTATTTGAQRPGEWDLLYTTCINSGYRNEDVALKVLKESLERYDIDGVFFNAPHPGPCSCGNCRRKYMEYYGQPLPSDPSQYAPDWMSRILRDCVDQWYKQVKAVKQDIPLILYYAISHDNLFDRLATCDMICCEPQDVLSLGWQNIPQSWKPALCIRLGRSEPDIAPVPFGIIHSCPGMDWRHTGLPPAEYRYWMSQVPANGGMIWHSITGFCDTIPDKRILDCVSEINHQIMAVEKDMHRAVSTAEVALLWSMEGKGGLEKAFLGQAGNAAEGWAEALIDRQVPFDVLLREQVLAGRLSKYKVLVIPQGNRLDDEMTRALAGFTNGGGKILMEGVPDVISPEALAMLGIHPDVINSESLVASYLRFEESSKGNPLAAGFERTPMIAHRGVVQYVRPLKNTQCLATLVPPFAPLEAVGAPPERSSIPNPKSDLPLCLYHETGRGGVLLMPFEISRLITAYKLGEHAMLAGNAINMLLGGSQHITCTHVRGLQVMGYEYGGAQLIHLVNGVGQRPLDTNVALTGLQVRVRWNGNKPPRATALLSGQPIDVSHKDGWAEFTLDRLAVWEVVKLEQA